MRRGRRWAIRLLVAFALWMTFQVLTRNRLTVSNASGMRAEGLTVGVGGETIAFGDLAPGAVRQSGFRIRHSETFDVRGRLEDGTAIHEYVGYVVWEDDLFGTSATIRILPAGELECSQ